MANRGPLAEGACKRPDLARLLVHVDDLPPAEETQLRGHAAECPVCGPRLALIEQAEAWLAGQAQNAPSVPNVIGECPPAEELYDFGRGPGARPLPSSREIAVRAHVEACGECAGLVATLAARPPVPLWIDVPTGASTAERARPARRHWMSYALAAAAVVLISLGLFWHKIFAGAPVTELASVVYPAETLLRGEADGAIHFPRGRVLAGKEAGLWHALQVELAQRADATRYRVHLLRADGGAFDAGAALCVLEADGPMLTLDDAAVHLAPGHYTCEAWAVVNGLDVPLGRRDFEVVHDAEIERALAEPPSDARGQSALLARMHERGLLVDARAYARSLPPTPERDAYLRRLPGR